MVNNSGLFLDEMERFSVHFDLVNCSAGQLIIGLFDLMELQVRCGVTPQFRTPST